MSQEAALMRLDELTDVYGLIQEVISNRRILGGELMKLSFVEKVYPSEANFLLVEVKNVDKVYEYLLEQGILVKNCSAYNGYEQCLRITIGSPEENQLLLESLIDFEKK